MCSKCGGEGFEVAPEDVEQLDQNVRASGHNWGQLVDAAKILAGEASFELAVAKVATRVQFLVAEEVVSLDAFFYAVAHAVCVEAGLGAKESELPPMVTTEVRG
jgi:hypothetical protein